MSYNMSNIMVYCFTQILNTLCKDIYQKINLKNDKLKNNSLRSIAYTY